MVGGHGLASWEPHPRHPRPAPQLVSRGCETRELALPRDGQGRLGFDVDTEGFITHVERFTFAETQGLRPGARLLRVCGQTLPSLGPEGAAQLLRSAPKVCVTVLPPDEGGRPRRSELQAWGGTGGGVAAATGHLVASWVDALPGGVHVALALPWAPCSGVTGYRHLAHAPCCVHPLSAAIPVGREGCVPPKPSVSLEMPPP